MFEQDPIQTRFGIDPSIAKPLRHDFRAERFLEFESSDLNRLPTAPGGSVTF